MDFKNILKLLGAILIALVLGTGLGYYYAPDKVKIEEKIVYRTKTVKEESKTVTEKFDSKTGNVVERKTETGTKETNIDTVKSEKKRETEKTKKMWAVKVGGYVPVKNPTEVKPRVGGEVRLPFFNSWAGAEVDLELGRPAVGAYLRLEF